MSKATKFVGRPRKYETPEEMQEVITQYFNECAEEGIYPTVSMLAYRRNMSRKELLDYEKCIELDTLKNCSLDMKREFSNTVKRSKQYIEAMYENKMVNTNTNVVGMIFCMKNNFNWVDKTEQVVENKTISVELED